MQTMLTEQGDRITRFDRFVNSLQNGLLLLASVQGGLFLVRYIGQFRLPGILRLPGLRIVLPTGSVSIWSIGTLFLLAVTVAPKAVPEKSITGPVLFMSTFLIVPPAYHLLQKIGHFLAFTFVIGAVVCLYAILRYGVGIGEGLEEAAIYVNMSALVGIGTGTILELRWAPDLIVVGLGLYYLVTRFEMLVRGDNLGPDISALIYTPLARIASHPTGTACAGLVFTAMFWVMNAVPNLLVFPASGAGYTKVGWLPQYTAVVGAPFFVLLFAHWLLVLRRLPYSIDFWDRGFHLESHRDKLAPPRPPLIGLILALMGWLLAAGPQWSARVSNRFPMTETTWITVTYLLLLPLLSILAGVLVFRKEATLPYLQRLPLPQPKDPETIRGDHRHLLLAFLLIVLAIAHGALVIRSTPFDLVYLLLLITLVWAEINRYRKPRYELVGISSSLLIMGLPFLVPTRSVYWNVLIFFAFGHLTLRAASRISRRLG